MYRKTIVRLLSLAMKAAASALAVTGSVATPLAQAGPGDLDPSFADLGRLGPIPDAAGEARSIELLDAGGILVGGGDFDLFFQTSTRDPCLMRATSFASQLGDDGAADALFDPADAASIEAYGIARQADGRIVAVGHKAIRNIFRCTIPSITSNLAVFRVGNDGLLDTGFGVDGVFLWSTEGNSQAGSLALEPDGRIVVAGTRSIAVGDATESRIVVLRLLGDGSLDNAFGEEGVFLGPIVSSSAIRLVRTENGSYRVSANGVEGCAIVGLTTDGEPGSAFGSAGIATLGSPGGDAISCHSLELLTDGSLLVAGNAGEHAFVARLLANGAPDPAFVTDPAIANSMTDATAITAIANGKVLVAGLGADGVSIMRLHASGEQDANFGDDGHTWIDLLSDFGSTPIVRDMAVREDGSVIAAGGDSRSDQPFVVRLIGDEGGASPGIVGFSENFASPQESDGQAVFRVRRSGGSDGGVSVSYRTMADLDATADKDFKAKSGTLHWDDGDTSEREIVLEIVEDGGPPEIVESFHVTLDDAQGGAGLGTRFATVNIQPDGAPGGQIEIGGADPTSGVESNMQVWLHRSYYFEGRVCVTLTASSGTAIAGEDFDEAPSTHCWDDQDAEAKLAEIPIVDDNKSETDENFNIELSNPTGGAIIGQQGLLTVGIAANDQPTSPPPPPPPGDNGDNGGDGGNGGGGPAGVAELLLLLGLLLARQQSRRAKSFAA